MNTDNLAKLKNYCAYQERCHKEVRTKLLELGERGDDLEEIIVELIKENFLNEERFALAYAHGKFSILKWGKIKIANGLKQKGVADKIISKAIGKLDLTDYENCLQQLTTSKWESLKTERSMQKRRQKTLSYMQQKGYEYNLVMPILMQL